MKPLISQLAFCLCLFLNQQVQADCLPVTVPPALTSLSCQSFMDEENCQQLCVIRTEQESHWFLFSPQAYTRTLTVPASFYGVSDFKISPTGEWLAVASSGEGHPAIDVFLLAPLLVEPIEGQTVEARYSINPYPGSIDLERWENANTLLINTDRWLPYNTPLFQEKFATFALNVTTGNYHTDDKTLTDPVQYYTEQLKRLTDDWEKQEARRALEKIKEK
ncbi:hypothetical protein BegalDRAFT_0570 [Beggiatoa alba B18LD]|uniref:Uncharacterized protein n=1 Tax=Beggiatoa alba B18LD TaxID=395493 RepID=I3CCZ5_9GAMM|nr:hypothetical protein [Beggiatoa alba]EIJ41488.1 hypothetical protein BegalDRAFT_0570 [Beggiatoa alba B18LD]